MTDSKVRSGRKLTCSDDGQVTVLLYPYSVNAKDIPDIKETLTAVADMLNSGHNIEAEYSAEEVLCC